MGTRPSQDDRRTTRGQSARQDQRPPLVGQAPGAEVRIPLRTWFGSMMLWMISVGLLALAFPPLRWTWVAHLALVPMLVAIARSPGRRVLMGSAALAGLVFYGAEMYWMQMVTWGAYVGVVLYCLIVWVLFAVLLKWTLDRTRLPLVLLAPLFWVALEWCRSWLLTGFPWLYLGHPQAATPILLQLADLTGAYGLSALSAATAGFLADLLTHPMFLRYGTRVRLARTIAVSLLVLTAMWSFVLVYGTMRLQPVDMTDGPLVVTVQPNVPQELRWFTPENPSGKGEDAPADPASSSEDDLFEEEPEDPSYRQAMQLTAEAAAKWPEADLIIWPETTVVDSLNKTYLEAEFPGFEKASLIPAWSEQLKRDPERLKQQILNRDLAQVRAQRRWHEIGDLAGASQVALLVGALAIDEDPATQSLSLRRNSAYLFRENNRTYECTSRYDKVHLVPFGEFTPFSTSAPWLYRLLLKFTPYDAAYNLTPGERLTVMTVGRKSRPEGGSVSSGGRFAVPICFEDAFAGLCREMAYAGGEKRIDFLVNISNDGWFYGTVELDQHWDLSVFRAVENRVPVVRSVNTGLSGFIDSCGRTELRVSDESGHERSISGLAAMQLRFDPRSSFYGLYGDVFAWTLSGAAGLILLVATFHPRRAKTAGDGPVTQETKKETAS